MEDVVNILKNAIHLSVVTKVMRTMSASSPVLQYRFFPFMSSASSLFFGKLSSVEECSTRL